MVVEADICVEAWRALLLANSRAVRAIEADLAEASQIPLSWYDVLLELNSAPHRRLRMCELGERAVLSRTRVSRIVDELEAEGLVACEPDTDDGRVLLAVITSEGRAALRAAWPLYRQRIQRHFGDHLTERERRVIAAALGRVAEREGPLLALRRR